MREPSAFLPTKNHKDRSKIIRKILWYRIAKAADLDQDLVLMIDTLQDLTDHDSDAMVNLTGLLDGPLLIQDHQRRNRKVRSELWHNLEKQAELERPSSEHFQIRQFRHQHNTDLLALTRELSAIFLIQDTQNRKNSIHRFLLEKRQRAAMPESDEDSIGGEEI